MCFMRGRKEQMKSIPLSGGMVALVDDSDYESLRGRVWRTSRTDHRLYAVTDSRSRGVRTFAYMHRLIMKAESQEVVDHIDGDGLNNQRVNLRCCKQHQNLANSARRSDNTSGYKGVSWSAPMAKWMAMHMFNGERLYLGCFQTPIGAALAYDKSLRERCGEFARTNEMLGLL
jgi:hypothetical protein